MHARKEGVRDAWEGGIKRGSERKRNKLTVNTVSEAEATLRSLCGVLLVSQLCETVMF